MDKNSGKYNNFAIILHWIMVLLIFFMIGLGWFMVDLEKGSPERSYYFALHKSIGLTLALLVLIRLIWRIIHRPPELPEFIAGWKKITANITHNLLYLFMFLQPVTGYISSSFSGYNTKFWGIPLPPWGWKDQVINQLFTDIHEVSSVALICLISIHLVGVFNHVYARENSVLLRMIPYKR